MAKDKMKRNKTVESGRMSVTAILRIVSKHCCKLCRAVLRWRKFRQSTLLETDKKGEERKRRITQKVDLREPFPTHLVLASPQQHTSLLFAYAH